MLSLDAFMFFNVAFVRRYKIQDIREACDYATGNCYIEKHKSREQDVNKVGVVVFDATAVRGIGKILCASST